MFVPQNTNKTQLKTCIVIQKSYITIHKCKQHRSFKRKTTLSTSTQFTKTKIAEVNDESLSLKLLFNKV